MPTPTPGYANAAMAALSAVVFDDGSGTPKVVTPTKPLPTISMTVDNEGIAFNLDACSFVYGQDATGQIVTVTATDGAVVRVLTTTFTNGVISSRSKWVVQ